MLIAQISDLHIRPHGKLAYGVSETNLYTEHAINALLRFAPKIDCVIVTGDLTDCGLEEEYQIVSELFDRLPMQVYAVPGNHDRRDAFRFAFRDKGYLPASGHLNYTINCGGVRIIALDSLKAGESHGELAEETLDFLKENLARFANEPTLIMLHHPPFDTGIDHMDSARLFKGRDELEKIVANNSQVKRILCGHVHRSIQKLFAGSLCQIAPSVTHQVTLDLQANGPSCFMLEDPEFLIHQFNGQDFVTHTAKVTRAAGPFPFILPDDYPGKKR